MRRPQGGGAASDFASRRLDNRRESVEKCVERGNSLGPAAARANESLGVRGGRHNEPLARVAGFAEGCDGREVVHVVGIKGSNDDAGVENDQFHSSRNSSSSPGR